MCITASQMQWTADVTKALGLTKERGDKKGLKSLKKKQVLFHNILLACYLLIYIVCSKLVFAKI